MGRTGPTDPTHYCGKEEMTQLDTHADIHAAMQAYGQRARAAAREIRRATDKSKAAALRAMADLIEERGEQLKRENALDLEAARRNGLAEAMVDRLAVTDKTLAGMAPGLRPTAAAPAPAHPPPHRPAGGAPASSAGRDRHHFGVAPQRAHRCGRTLPEGGQCHHSARGQRSFSFEPGTGHHHSGRPGARRPAPARGP